MLGDHQWTLAGGSAMLEDWQWTLGSGTADSVERGYTGSRDPPFAQCGLKKSHCGDIKQCRTPHKVSTTSQCGTPNGVRHCSMSPQLYF